MAVGHSKNYPILILPAPPFSHSRTKPTQLKGSAEESCLIHSFIHWANVPIKLPPHKGLRHRESTLMSTGLSLHCCFPGCWLFSSGFCSRRRLLQPNRIPLCLHGSVSYSTTVHLVLLPLLLGHIPFLAPFLLQRWLRIEPDENICNGMKCRIELLRHWIIALCCLEGGREWLKRRTPKGWILSGNLIWISLWSSLGNKYLSWVSLLSGGNW